MEADGSVGACTVLVDQHFDGSSLQSVAVCEAFILKEQTPAITKIRSFCTIGSVMSGVVQIADLLPEVEETGSTCIVTLVAQQTRVSQYDSCRFVLRTCLSHLAQPIVGNGVARCIC